MRTIALTTTLLMLCGQSTASAQLNDAAGRPSDRVAGTQKSAAAGADRAAAVAHALCMAIEGSELWQCAEKSQQSLATARREVQTNPPERGDLATALQKHARSSFAESTRLFEAVKNEKPLAGAREPNQADMQACQAFYAAAWNYSKALEACCKKGDEDRSQAAMMEPARVALLNHAVKEAVGSVGLRKMIQYHNDASEASTALLSHAKAMMDSSREALATAGASSTIQRQAARPIINDGGRPADAPGNATATTPTPRGDAPAEVAGNQAAGAQDLASLARAVVDAVQALDQGAPAGVAQPATRIPGQDR